MATASKATPKTKVKPRPQADSPTITITEVSTCKTLNGKSTLEYALGRDANDKLHFRIMKNDGGGHYSSEWLSEDAILTALAKVDPITAYPLRNLTTGKSVNTAGFILAVLVAEGVVERVPKKTRHYRYPLPNAAPNIRKDPPSKHSPPASAKPTKKPTKTNKK